MSSGDNDHRAVFYHALKGTIVTSSNWSYLPGSDHMVALVALQEGISMDYQTAVRSLGVLKFGREFWIGANLNNTHWPPPARHLNHYHYLIPLDRKTIMRYENLLFRDDTGSGTFVCHPLVHNPDMRNLITRLFEPKE